MPEQINKYQSELARLIERYVVQDGAYETAVPSLFFFRQSSVNEPRHIFHQPSLCIIFQGGKEICLAAERFRYGPADYLISSVGLPVTGQVIEASPNVPYLSLKLEFTPNQIVEIINASEAKTRLKEDNKHAMYVCRIEAPLLDAVARLARLVDTPEDIPVLAPLFTKEIFYRVLQGAHGNILKQFAIEGSYAYQVRKIVKQITQNYDQTLRIEELAKIANMSVPTLHRHFKEITAMSPIQFQKQLRLQEARQLLLSETIDAADAAFRVGYESPSQFSREYSRMFGLPPKEEIKRLREKYAQL
ncbi:AraC family transcriptional regulator [Pectinatus haikarae]|uniref:AraC family transcriptional regulator n=1 Tax=Pectinatus haikarae TaxID=349096 RepID=UPI0018C538B2|nr:AraC family transcriptional regulator [Pectinatus haikarae]